MSKAQPFEGLAVTGDRVLASTPAGTAHFKMNPDDMRRFAIALLMAADRQEGLEASPYEALLYAQTEGNA